MTWGEGHKDEMFPNLPGIRKVPSAQKYKGDTSNTAREVKV